MRDRLEGVAVFVEAVEAGGFARAADRLALTRSAVGKAIARLEARLGTRLFQRTTRVQILTEEGQAYYQRCRRALDELREGERLLESGRSEIAGPLRLSMPVLFGRHCVLPVLLDLAALHPGLELDLRFSDSMVDVIGDGFDLAIRSGRTADGSGLLTRALVSHRKIVCAAPAYLGAYGAPQDTADLAAHAALIYWRNNQPLPWSLADAGGTLRTAELNWRLRFDDLEAILAATLAGMGLAFLPEWLVGTHLREGRLVALFADRASASVDTFAVWPDTPHPSRRLRLLVDTLIARLPETASSHD